VFLAALLLVAVGALALVGGTAAASHGPDKANFTVEPMDRTPGATNVKYGQTVVGLGDTDLRTLERTTAVYEAGSWANCGSSDGEILGVDRGSTRPGYETDESLKSNVKRFSAGEDVFELEFYGEDDFGASTHLDAGDEFVSVATCIKNPDEPGWYQISGSTTGVTENGERVTFGDESHYFWIGNFENEQEARAELGPPPSEPQQTPTPTPQQVTETGSTNGSESGSDGTESGTTEENEDEDAAGDRTTETPTPRPTETVAPASARTERPTATPTETAAEWDGAVVRTPTPGDGPGFGPLVALLSLLAVALFVRRR
jgi:PGF-CTERM protein